jgi:hypothetical protein
MNSVNTEIETRILYNLPSSNAIGGVLQTTSNEAKIDTVTSKNSVARAWLDVIGSCDPTIPPCLI